MIQQPYLCDDCGERFYNVGWHGEVCGSSNYRLVLAEAGPPNPRNSRDETPTTDGMPRDDGPVSASTPDRAGGAPGETTPPLPVVSPVQLALVPEQGRGAYDEEAA